MTNAITVTNLDTLGETTSSLTENQTEQISSARKRSLKKETYAKTETRYETISQTERTKLERRTKLSSAKTTLISNLLYLILPEL